MIVDPRRWYRLTVAALAGARAELDAIREAFEHAVHELEEYRATHGASDHDNERTP